MVFLCYRSTGAPDLQATLPLLLCNEYISSRIPKAASIQHLDTPNPSKKAGLAMPAERDDTEPQRWGEPLLRVLKISDRPTLFELH